MDMNKVFLSGQVVQVPETTSTNKGTHIVFFDLQVNEEFNNRRGDVRTKPNIIRIEALGKAAQRVLDIVVPGGRYFIDGYIRQDYHHDKNMFRVRAFSLYPDVSRSAHSYNQGIRKAIDLLRDHEDVDAAISALSRIVAGGELGESTTPSGELSQVSI